MSLAIKEGFKWNELTGRCTLFHIRIDVRCAAAVNELHTKVDTLWHCISIWFDECSAVVLKSGLHGQLGDNPQL